MATIIYDVQTAPDDMVAAESLVVDTTYSCQVQGRSDIFILEATSAPNANAIALSITPGNSFIATPKSGEMIFVWCHSSDAKVVINTVD